MTQPPHDYKKMVAMLLNQKKPLEMRAHMLVAALNGGEPANLHALAAQLLGQLAPAAPAAELEELKAKFDQAIKELEQGGVRPGTFIGEADGQMPGPHPRIHTVTPDGQERFPFLHPDVKLDALCPGMTTYLDPKGAIVLGHSDAIPMVGPQAQFVRRVPGTSQVEVNIRDESATLYASQQVLDAEAAGELVRGDQVLICPQRQFAFARIPDDKDRRHRFVDRSKLPNVVPARDIGSPHSCLGWLLRRTRTLMFRDDLRQKYDQRPRVSLMMIGPSGTGKTLTIKAFLTAFDQLVVQRTGRTDVGSRVVRVKMSEQLSQWLSVSDKNFEQLFDDVQALASETVETTDGERILVPVVVIFEEVDGVARRRSDGDYDGAGGALDRILGTLLQRLDDPMDELAHLPLVLISTSNRPSMIDVAMFRRLGAKVARFNRLDRQGLAAVLNKKVKPHYPLASKNGTSPKTLRKTLIDEVVADLFSPQNEEVALLELTLRDGTKVVKYSRDFLTGAVIEQALSDAIDQLIFFAEQSGRADVGLDSSCISESLHRQIDALANNVTAYNAPDYVDLPDHSHVANVRRLPGSNGRLHQLVPEEDD